MEKQGASRARYHGADQDLAVLAEKALGLGYPVLINLLRRRQGMKTPLTCGVRGRTRQCQTEALSAFGDGRLIEKYFSRTRHVESNFCRCEAIACISSIAIARFSAAIKNYQEAPAQLSMS